MSEPKRILDLLGQVPEIRAVLGASDRSRITGVASPAVSVVAALFARASAGTVWVICSDARSQEELCADLLAWGVRARVFPELEAPDEGEFLPDPEALSERLELLELVGARAGARPVIVLTQRQLDLPVPAVQTLRDEALGFQKGGRVDLETVFTTLLENGYESVPKIYSRGQVSKRGGILDIYSWQHALPIRIEFFDDEVESIREFQIDSQLSVGTLETCSILLGDPERKLVPISDFFAATDAIIAAGCDADSATVTISTDPSDGKFPEFLPAGFDGFEAGDVILNEAKGSRFFGQLQEWLNAKWTVSVFCNNEGEAERFGELVRERALDPSRIEFLTGSLARGFVCADAKLAVLSDAEIFGRSSSQRMRRQLARRDRAEAARGGMDFTEFEPGDLVVHLDHGIGRYLGMEKLGDAGADAADVLAIEFADEARLFVPLDQAWQVSRYVGLGKRHPGLSQLGDGRWDKAKQKVEKSIFDYAGTMLRLQAERETQVGFAFGADTHWQDEFEGAFVFQTTADQARAISETKNDMEGTRPMDRLICGDVGFGKTEVAIRAAFKAVMGGRQVAFLAPTTVLAQQHFQTLRERMSEYPVRVEALHRFRSKKDQRDTVKGLVSGSVDIVVGTHRLLSADVVFKNLGLVIVDEEQRFGVKHKEMLKEKFRLIDVLTLSATPIPRTLYLALMGARDMSLIETPPANRKPVETVICAYDERVLRDAIDRELRRGGQVYVLHNRVQSIEKVAARIGELCPGAKIGVGHGQMKEDLLEDVMRAFVDGKLDVLVSTTIIESGLDIPNANTIIIDRADRFGLADLYQLRGRVGRSHHKAYAILMLPRDLLASGDARKRVMAIRQYSELGAGFKIAMRDLEIRGAGNILGTAQSGHILAVGFDLYCRLLKRAVSTIKGETQGTRGLATARLDFLCTNEPEFAGDVGDRAPAFIPTAYIGDAKARIEAYRKLADASDADALGALANEWKDRFGPIPAAARNLLDLHRIRQLATERRIRLVETREAKLMLTKRKDFILFGGKFPRLTSNTPENKLIEIAELLEKRIHL